MKRNARSLVIATLLVVGVWLTGTAHAATATWKSSGNTGVWNTAGNWSTGSVPGASDNVVFNTGSINCSIDTSPTVNNITIASSYTGTISQSGSRTVWAKGTYTQSAATVNAIDKLIVDGAFSISAGTFNAPTVLAVGGTFSISGSPTLSWSGNTLILNSSTANQSYSLSGLSLNNVVFSDGLTAFWRLDETSGTSAADSSGYGLTLTHRNTPTISATVPSVLYANVRSLSFDKASTEYLDDNVSTTAVPLHLQHPTWTYSAWVKPTTLDANVGGAPECSDGKASDILSLGNNNGIRICALAASPTAVMLRGHMRNTNGGYNSCASSNTVTLNDGNWHHVVVVNNGTNMIVYYDNTKTSCSAYTYSQAYDVAKAVTIGRSGGGAVYHTDGQIDEVRIWKRVLSDDEIGLLYHGTHPGAYTLTASTAVTAAGSMTIGSGTLTSSSTFDVGGSWLNIGGYFTGTGTVSLNNTSGSLVLQSNRQPFSALTVTGSSGGATWTMADALDVDGTLTLTRGTLDASGYTINAGGISQGANGTLTASTATVVIDGTSSPTLATTGTMGHLRIEDPTETSLIGYWKFDRLAGTTAPDSSGSGAHATLANGAYFTTNVPSSPAPTFNNPGAIYFDGVDDEASFTMPTSSSVTYAGWIFLVSNGTNGGSFPRILELPNGRLSVRTADSYRIAFEAAHSTTTGIWRSATTDAIGLGAWYHVAVTYDGSNTSNNPIFYINGVTVGGAQAPTTPPSGTRTTSGGTAYIGSNAANDRSLNAYLDDWRIYNTVLTAAQVKALAAGRYPGTGGTATTTLGANTTVNGLVQVDSGSLSTSSYTLAAAASDSSQTATVNTGTLTIGSSTATFSGGLTAIAGTTIAMNTSGGTLKIGNNKALTIDGTFDASTAGVTPSIACASASSCFYNFVVGSSATATPTLNIDGLTISQLATAGMNINSVTGSSTTFTKFDNITFSGGTGTYQLQIAASTLTLYANGLSFDNTSKTKNAKLSDTDGSGNDVRLYVGGTCSPTTDCESIDEDDDTKLVDGTTTGSDGTPDDASADGAVIQWLYRSHTDTGGSAVGFPTSAFDWDTFAYRKTYVAFNSVSTSCRLFARDTDGYASSGTYYWTAPTASDSFVGSPRFTQETVSMTTKYYVWVVTNTGRVYKIEDTGSALTTVASYPFRDGASATATSPLSLDSTNVYWAGNNGSGSRKIFSLPQNNATTLNGSGSLTADLTAFPAAITVGGTTTIYAAINGTVYKYGGAFGTPTTVSVTDTAVAGRMTLYQNILYFIETDGTVWALNSSDLSTNWSYQDTNATRHSGGCTSSNQCSSQNLFVQVNTGRVTYGDKDGHVYVVSKSGSTGTLLSGYPYRPGLSTDIFLTAPLVSNGIIAIGTSGGKVFLIDQQNASSAPNLLRTYNFRSAISSISYDRNSSVSGEYMITTADGRLFYVSRITDPTPSND